ncbi:MAG: nucleotidyltransferase family protein [Methanocorpusculum sp.]|nr:nucleotidyltransferase family protein [Methanocorpusculum sp.]
MMPAYVSIKEDVLTKLETHIVEIRERFGVDTLAVFGSVSRGEDTADSDIDILYSYREGTEYGMFHTVNLIDYLENLFGRKVDLMPIKYMKPSIRPYIEQDVIFIQNEVMA